MLARTNLRLMGVFFLLGHQIVMGQCPPDLTLHTTVYCASERRSFFEDELCQCCVGQERYTFNRFGLKWGCRTCPVGKVQEITSSSPCYDCGAGLTQSGTSCIPCSKGTFKASPGAHACSHCPEGKYADEVGRSVCKSCEQFSTSPQGSTANTNCLCIAGYRGSNGGFCFQCSAGTYKPSTGSSCTDCIAGKYSTTTGAQTAAVCVNCDPGKISTAAASVCTNCVAGKYNTVVGSGECSGCSAGKYSTATGAKTADVCVNCQANSYTASTGSSQCTPCASGSFSFAGATACTSCDVGKYWGATGCTACTQVLKHGEGYLAGAASDAACVIPAHIYCTQNSYCGNEVNYPSKDTCNCCPGEKFYSKYQPYHYCVSCSPSQYQPTTISYKADLSQFNVNDPFALLECHACPEGKRSGARARRCWPQTCSAGQYLIANGSHIECKSCAAGKFSTTTFAYDSTWDGAYGDTLLAQGDSVCIECPAGKFTPGAGASSSEDCNLCGAGQEFQRVTFAGEITRLNAVNMCPPAVNGFYDAVYYSPVNKPYYRKEWYQTEKMSGGKWGIFSRIAADGGIVPAGLGYSSTDKWVAYVVQNVEYPHQITAPWNCWDGSTSSWKSRPTMYFEIEKFCVGCAAGKYKEMGGDYSCIACPPNSYSPNTSSAVCDCNPGYTGSGSLNCTACEAGKYKDTQGSSSCIACPAGKFSGAGATFCRLCVSGTYSGATGVSVCTNCVEGKYFRSPGQTSNVCISCEAGNYSDAGAAECNLCVPGTEIQPITGLTRVNAINMCPPLPNGFWNNGAMSSYSIIRNPGVWTIYSTKQSEAGQLPPEVRGNFWSYWVAYAVDNTNKYSTITATWNCWDREAAQWNSYPKMRFSTNTCVGCASGKYKEMPGNYSCIACPPNSYSPNNSSAVCDCNPGYTGSGSLNCTACETGKYKNTQGSSSCTACPANLISTAGSVDITDCKCNPGHTGADGGNCTACPQSTYKPLRGSGACTECSTTYPNTAHALTGQVNSTGCVCDAGYRLTTGVCESCPEGTYKIPLGDSLCLPCSGNSTSKPASTNPSACVCNAGYAPMRAQSSVTPVLCSACIAGKFKNATSRAPSSATSDQYIESEKCKDCDAGLYAAIRV